MRPRFRATPAHIREASATPILRRTTAIFGYGAGRHGLTTVPLLRGLQVQQAQQAQQAQLDLRARQALPVLLVTLARPALLAAQEVLGRRDRPELPPTLPARLVQLARPARLALQARRPMLRGQLALQALLARLAGELTTRALLQILRLFRATQAPTQATLATLM